MHCEGDNDGSDGAGSGASVAGDSCYGDDRHIVAATTTPNSIRL